MKTEYHRNIQKAVRRAFLLPVALLLVNCVTAAGVTFATVPQIERAYSDRGISAPYVVKVLFRASHLFDR